MASESMEPASSDIDSAAIPLVQLPITTSSKPAAQPPTALSKQQSEHQPARLSAQKSTQPKESTDLASNLLPAAQPVLPETILNVVEDPLPTEAIATDSIATDSVESPAEREHLEAENLETENSSPASKLEDLALEDPLEGADEEQPDKPSEPSSDGILVSLADFPHLSNAQSGCFGLSECHQSQGNYRDVGEQLTAQMRQQGYQLTEKEDIDGAGHRVYEVVNPDEPGQIYYLNVFSDGLDSAVYALTVDVLSLEELKALNA